MSEKSWSDLNGKCHAGCKAASIIEGKPDGAWVSCPKIDRWVLVGNPCIPAALLSGSPLAARVEALEAESEARHTADVRAFIRGYDDAAPPRDHGPALSEPCDAATQKARLDARERSRRFAVDHSPAPASRDREETMCGERVDAPPVDHAFEIVSSELNFLAAGRLSAIGNAKAIQSVLGEFSALRAQLAEARQTAEMEMQDAADLRTGYGALQRKIDDLSRDLKKAERERDEARAELDRITVLYAGAMSGSEKLRSDLARVRETLREVLATVRRREDHSGGSDHHPDDCPTPGGCPVCLLGQVCTRAEKECKP